MEIIRFRSRCLAAGVVALGVLCGTAAAYGQEKPAAQAGGDGAASKIAVIDIDRIAAESEPGKKVLQKLKEESDRLVGERQKKEQELAELRRRVPGASDTARAALEKEIEKKEIDFKRWQEDKQRELADQQQAGLGGLQKQLGPIIEQFAKEKGIGLILRATAGLTFVIDPALDITDDVIAKFNAAAAPPPAKSGEPPQVPPKN